MPSNSRVFVDVCGWRCFLDRQSPHHEETVACVRHIARQRHCLLTTNVVLGELFVALSCQYEVPRAQLVDIVDTLRRSPLLEIVHVDPTLEAAAWDLLRAHPDRQWSLADATSFAVMRAHGLERALTTNAQFSEAGFTRLLV